MENSTAFENITNLTRATDENPRTQAEFLQKYAPWVLTVDRVVSPIFYVVGLIGNPIAVRIWMSRRMRKNNSSAVYVGTLAVVHTIFLLYHIMMELTFAWDISTYDVPVFCEVFNVMVIMPQYFAPLLVLAFTVERYIAVNHPFQKERFCTVRRAAYVSLLLGIFSLLLSLMQIYFWTFNAKFGKCQHLYHSERAEFERIWTLTTETLLFFVVPICVLIFNILVIIEIRKLTTSGPMVTLQHQAPTSSNPTSTVTLLSVSFYLICTLLPASVVYSSQALVPKVDLSAHSHDLQIYIIYFSIRKIVEEICLSNYACYFFIYYITGQYFRKEVKKLFGISAKCKATKRRDSATLPGKKSEYTLVSSNGKTGCEYNSTQI